MPESPYKDKPTHILVKCPKCEHPFLIGRSQCKIEEAALLRELRRIVDKNQYGDDKVDEIIEWLEKKELEEEKK